jgi:hypothetical protein
MTDNEYHADTTAISKSGVSLMLKTPRHYWERYLNPNPAKKKETDALRFGKALHLFCLEPHRAAEGIAILPVLNPYTNDGKRAKAEFLAANEGKSIVTNDEYKQVKAMAASLRENANFRKFMAQGEAEKTVFFKRPFDDEPESEAPCKIRMDWWNPERNVILDIKSCEDASPVGFGRSCRTYGYHIADQFYKDGARIGLGLEKNPIMIFAAVEKEPPYACAMYLIPQPARDFARQEIDRALHQYMECKASGFWPGYGDEVTQVQFPMWGIAQAR